MERVHSNPRRSTLRDVPRYLRALGSSHNTEKLHLDDGGRARERHNSLPFMSPRTPRSVQQASRSHPTDGCEGGDNIDLTACFFNALVEDARKRDLLCDEYYFLSDSALRTFKRFQCINPDLKFPGYRVEQAYLIWRQPHGQCCACCSRRKARSCPLISFRRARSPLLV